MYITKKIKVQLDCILTVFADGKPIGEVIDLGHHNSDFDWSNEQNIKEKMFKKKTIQKYHTQYYINGTECNVINHKRDTEVRVRV